MCMLVLVLLPLWALTYLAKMRVSPPADALLVNDATFAQLGQVLAVPPEIAQKVVTWREHAHGLESVDALLDAPLFTDQEATRLSAVALSARIDARSATARQFAAVLGMPLPIARRLAAYRDGLLPSPFEAADRPPTPQHPSALDAGSLLHHAPLLDSRATRPVLSRFLMRSPQTVQLHFWIGAAIFGLVSLLLPAWMRARNRGGDPFLVPLSILLSGLGVAILFSVKDPLRDRTVYEHHLLGFLFSLLVMVLCARLAPQARARIRSYLYLWVIGAFLLVAALFVFGSGPEGVKLNLFHFQPVEIIKLFLTLFLAGYLADRADLIADTSARRLSGGAYTKPGRRSGWSPPRMQDLGPIVVMYIVALTLFLVIKDMGPGLLMFGTFVVLLCVTTGRGSFLMTGAALLAAGGLFGYLAHIGVFATRVDMWLHPFSNAHSNGMQLGQSYWALATGGWEGSGAGLGMPGLIPRGGSDLAFASWGEETGFAGGMLALLVYVVLVWRGVAIAMKASTDFDRALAFGLTILMALQTVLILGGVTGAIPLSGISLPFMSYGNSALVASFIAIGLLRGISARSSAGDGATPVRPAVTGAARRFALTYAAAMLLGIGALRLLPLQIIAADQIAVRPISTPDADHVRRPHVNPRLLAVERQIERGTIYDVAGRPLATSRLAEMLGTGKPAEEARRLADRHGRWYPFGAALAHVVGYLDPSVGGPFGLEKGYDTDLRGFDRLVDLLRDYRRRNLPGYSPRRGHDISLTIDARLQRDIQQILRQSTASLRDAVTGRRKDRAAFVLIRPETGDVLAAATLPAFDPNGLTPSTLRTLVNGQEAAIERPLINRATSGWYPPGSTFKVATTASALELLPNAEEIAFECNRISGDIRWRANGESYARSKIHDDRGDPDFGRITLPRAFEVSSNIYFANLAATLNPSDFRARLLDKLAFSHVPRQPYFDADLPDIGYGQGRMLASPLEMCRLCAAVANGGATMQSRFVTRIDTRLDDHLPARDKNHRPRIIERPPVVLAQGMGAATSRKVGAFMRGVVTNGTARGVFDDLPFAVAGKTGTAQNHQYDHQPHSWFVGFAPYDPGAPPKYAFACVVENGGYGKTVAAVICRDVLRKLAAPQQ